MASYQEISSWSNAQWREHLEQRVYALMYKNFPFPEDTPGLKALLSENSIEEFSPFADLPLLYDEEVAKKITPYRPTQEWSTQQVPRMTLYNKDQRKISIVTWFPTYCEGPPGHVHGGCITTMADHGAAMVAFRGAYYVDLRTANLNVNYRAGIPLKKPVLMEGSVVSVEKRKIRVELQFMTMDRSSVPPLVALSRSLVHGYPILVIYADCQALFIKISSSNTTYEQARQIFGPHIPREKFMVEVLPVILKNLPSKL